MKEENIKTILDQIIDIHGTEILWDTFEDDLLNIWQLAEYYKNWLINHEYDGFYNAELDSDGCGCNLDDLMPCSMPSLYCHPRRKS
jgi:hypothetical protein